jgi:hypothetical protein
MALQESYLGLFPQLVPHMPRNGSTWMMKTTARKPFLIVLLRILIVLRDRDRTWMVKISSWQEGQQHLKGSSLLTKSPTAGFGRVDNQTLESTLNNFSVTLCF